MVKEEKTTQEENLDRARELAVKNHEAQVASQPEVVEDKDAKNPEQVDLAKKK